MTPNEQAVMEMFEVLAERTPGYGVTLRELDRALLAEGTVVDPDDFGVLGIGTNSLRVRSLRSTDGTQVERDGMVVWLPADVLAVA